MVLKHVILVLADISGYTHFTRLRALSKLHAEQIISELLEAVIDQAQFPLQLSKLEGDAVFLYADSAGDATRAAAAQDVVRQVMAFFEAFHAKTRALVAANICPCSACGSIADLKLKAVLHEGEVVLKRIRQFDELGGEAVILLHRLAKNTVPADEYILATEAFVAASGPWPGQTLEPRVENVEALGPVNVLVYYPKGAGARMPARPLRDRLAQFGRVNARSLLRVLGLRSRATLPRPSP